MNHQPPYLVITCFGDVSARTAEKYYGDYKSAKRDYDAVRKKDSVSSVTILDRLERTVHTHSKGDA